MHSKRQDLQGRNRLFETQWQQLQEILINCERVRRSHEDKGSVITWQDQHYVSTPIRGERGGENSPRLRKGVKNIAIQAAGH